MKKCNKCKEIKEEKEFSPSHYKKNGGWCRLCNTEYMREFKNKNADKMKTYQQEYDKQHYQDNKNKIKEDKKIYYLENKENILENRKEYYQEHKKEKNKYNKKYYMQNKNTILTNANKYYKDNIAKVRKYNNQYIKNRKQQNPLYKIRASVSSSINIYLKNHGFSKNNKSISKYLPYTTNELKIHLESQFESWMTWKNYGTYRKNNWDDNNKLTWSWQIDHIIPQSNFKYSSMGDEEFKKCWALNNLRPYSSKQNLLDKNRLNQTPCSQMS